jgi:formyltetrahydrofolate synthetase
MNNFNKIQAMRQNGIMGQNELKKEKIDYLQKGLEELNKKLGKTIGYKGANNSMINMSLCHNTQEIRYLTHMAIKIQNDILIFSNKTIELHKKLQGNFVKLESQSEEEMKKRERCGTKESE